MNRAWEEAVAKLVATAAIPPLTGSGLERAARAVLHSKLSVSKVDQAIEAWSAAGVLSPETFNLDDLAHALGDAGLSVSRSTVAAVAKLGRGLIAIVGTDHEAWADVKTSTDDLREELLRIKGAGRTTVDRVLLTVFGRPVYPVDRESYRILVRHGHIDTSADYDEARSTIESGFPRDPEELRGLSAMFERVGEEFCRANAPRCENCPLQPWLPEGGPIDG